jgi:hypothetical protein
MTEKNFLATVQRRTRLAQIQHDLAAEAIKDLGASLESPQRGSDRPAELLDLYEDGAGPRVRK